MNKKYKKKQNQQKRAQTRRKTVEKEPEPACNRLDPGVLFIMKENEVILPYSHSDEKAQDILDILGMDAELEGLTFDDVQDIVDALQFRLDLYKITARRYSVFPASMFDPTKKLIGRSKTK